MESSVLPTEPRTDRYISVRSVLGLRALVVASLATAAVGYGVLNSEQSGRVNRVGRTVEHSLPGRSVRPGVTPMQEILRSNNSQLQLVLFCTVYWCGHKNPALRVSFSALRDTILRIAQTQGLTTVVSAVALDANPDTGLRWLSEISGFDEVSAGQQWLNVGALYHLWSDNRSVTSTPQVVVSLRKVRDSAGRILIDSNLVLLRFVGSMDMSMQTGMRDLDSLLQMLRHQ